MSLTREQKAALIDEIEEQIEGTPTIYVADYQGLSVAESNELRGRFREADVEYRVMKNTLMRLALERIDGLDELEEHLSGPTAVALSEEPATPARVIKDFREDTGAEVPQLKVAYVDGDYYPADALDTLASLKSRTELIGEVIGLLQAPLSNVMGGLQSQGETLAGAIQSIAEKEEE